MFQHLMEGEGWVQADVCVVSCRQFETHMLSVSVGENLFCVVHKVDDSIILIYI